MPEVARVADTLLLMDKGQIKSYGPIAKMLNRTDLGGRSSTEFDNFLVARLIKHEPQYGLSILESDLGTISVGTVNQEIGSTVRFTISARDISLTLERQQRTSILNIFAAKVEELQELDQSQVLLKLRANNTLVLAKITCKSVYNLALTPGLDVYCQAKTVSLL